MFPTFTPNDTNDFCLDVGDILLTFGLLTSNGWTGSLGSLGELVVALGRQIVISHATISGRQAVACQAG